MSLSLLQNIKRRLTPRRSMQTLHLASDLDGAWIPHAEIASQILPLENYLREKTNIVLTFATGRSLDSALQLIQGRVNVEPHHFVTDVGTVLYHRKSPGVWVEDKDYGAWVDERWDPDTAEKLLKAGLPEGVSFQNGPRPKRRVALQVDDAAELERCAIQLQMVAHHAGLAADILTSSHHYIDILPMDVDKGSAVRFLEERRVVPRPLFACGDSENNLGLFRIADVALLMSGSTLNVQDPRLLDFKLVRAEFPGPAGILSALKAWEKCE